jgi:hypothetical protein
MPTILKEDSILRQGWILIGRVGSDSKIGYYSWRIGEGNSNDAAKKIYTRTQAHIQVQRKVHGISTRPHSSAPRWNGLHHFDSDSTFQRDKL